MSDVQQLLNEANRLFAAKQYEQALARYLEAKAAAPQEVEVLYRLSTCQYKMRNLTGAIETVEAALAIDPSNKDLLLNLGLIAAKAGDKNKAMGAYDRLKKTDPKRAEQVFKAIYA